MSYLGRSPSQATRARYYYTATGGETSLSGSDDNGNTLVFSDGNYVDVMLNGVTLVAGTDYNTTTANTIGGLSALTASDVVEVVVYDTFSVFGGNVNGNFNIQNGTLTLSDGVVVSGGTGDNTLSIPDNLASAFDITESTNSYLKFVTTDSSEAIVAGKTLQTALVEPTTDDSSDLGTSSKRFQDLYLSGGVYLGGTGAANYIEDYEEGTWTPVYQGTTGSVGSTAYTFRTGNYTKVGDVVTISSDIVLSNKGSWTGAVIISGLPFTAANNNTNNSGALWVDNITFADQIIARIGSNEALVAFRINTSGNAGSYLDTTGVTNTGAFRFTITYFV